MGQSTESMFIMFALVILVYIIGMCIYLGCLKIKKIINKRRDLKFQERRDQNG
ncbi:hypothetical protein [uncultured Thomasclavelia sp.]|mgnify:FL=1|uniref:hypothetical protein n=1 Tax=uncultured Thomasclavelia sp. TaxID=3025759 RepID=UPI0025D43249|nr:hypothetical protein [uncultured Thomasclavelia sp.]